jgi:hypothetical protein
MNFYDLFVLHTQLFMYFVLLGQSILYNAMYSFLDLNRPYESLDRLCEEGLDIGWSTSIGYDGEVLATPKGRLEN